MDLGADLGVALDVGCRTGIFEGGLASSTGSGFGSEFLESLLIDHVGIDETAQTEEAFVLVDLIEEASDVGDALREDAAEYTDGLSGRTDDSEIQSRSILSFCRPVQSLVEVKASRGA